MQISNLNLSQTKWLWTITLGLMFLLALGLRLWGIGFGLPYIYHFDEHFYINTALKLGAGILNNPPYAPVGLANILVGQYGVYFVAGKLLGIFGSAQEFEAAFRNDPSTFYLLGRATSAFLGAGTVLALYVLGKNAVNRWVGLTGAALLAVSFLHVRDSHYAVPDVAMAFWVVLSVALAAVSMRTGRARYLYAAAIAGGLAVAMKYTALPVCLPVGWASLWLNPTPQKFTRRLLNKAVFITIPLFALGFALGSPQIILNPAPYINEAFGQLGADDSGSFDFWLVDDTPGYIFYLKTLYFGVGPVMLGLALLGTIWLTLDTIRFRAPITLLVLLFPLVYYLLMGSTRHYFARYAVPLVPFVAILAAYFLVMAASWLTAKNKIAGWSVAAGLLALTVSLPLAQSLRHNWLLTQEDTRTLAKNWIEANIPKNAKFAVDWPTHTPPLSTPDKVMPYSRSVYNVETVGGTGLADKSIDWYRQQGFDYLITSSFISNIPLVYKQRNQEREQFYNSLGQELQLIQAFYPQNTAQPPPFVFDEIYGPLVSLWDRNRPGPVLKIYGLNNPTVQHNNQ